MSSDNNTETIAKLIRASETTPAVLADKRGVEYAFIPKGPSLYEMRQLTPEAEVRRELVNIRENVSIGNADGLIAYVNRFKTDDTMIFANSEDGEIVAVIDYHPVPKNSGQEVITAPLSGFTDHRATLDLQNSVEWNTWCGVNGKMKDQKAFARFVEENAEDIVNPTGADLLEMVLDMNKGATLHVQSKLRTAGSGDGISNISRDVGGSELPPRWKLRIPVFFGEPKVDITAFARDELVEGKILLGFSLSRIEQVREAEIARIASRVAAETGVPMVLGSID